MQTQSGLANELGQSVSLKSVHVEGSLDGLLLSLKVQQRYLNDSDDTIEDAMVQKDSGSGQTNTMTTLQGRLQLEKELFLEFQLGRHSPP
mgnify:CR=1 FL=1